MDEQRLASPLVKQLKQKFDRLSTTILSEEKNKLSSQSQGNISRQNRVGDEADKDAAVHPLLPVCCFVIVIHFDLPLLLMLSNTTSFRSRIKMITLFFVHQA